MLSLGISTLFLTLIVLSTVCCVYYYITLSSLSTLKDVSLIYTLLHEREFALMSSELMSLFRDGRKYVDLFPSLPMSMSPCELLSIMLLNSPLPAS
jgi:hypothetical protein